MVNTKWHWWRRPPCTHQVRSSGIHQPSTRAPAPSGYSTSPLMRCTMKFGSWTYDGFQVDLQHVWQAKDKLDSLETIKMGIDLRGFYRSVEWDLLEVPAKKNQKFYRCCSETYPDITFKVTMRRKTLFHTVNLIIPCVAISFLTVLVFYLPSDRSLYLHPPLSYCVFPTLRWHHPTHLSSCTPHREVPAVHHDPRHPLHHCHRHRTQRLLPRTIYTHHVALGAEGVPKYPTSPSHHDPPQRGEGSEGAQGRGAHV